MTMETSKCLIIQDELLGKHLEVSRGFSDRDLPIKNGKISRVVVVYQRVTNDRS